MSSYGKQADPIWKKPTKAPSRPEHGAGFLFIHGYEDDAAGVENIADQMRSAGAIPHITWVIPNAPINRDAMAAAWYVPVGLSSVPPSRPELAEDEDEDGMLRSQRYLETLVDELHTTHHIPLNRIVVGGFSQGCVQSLLLALTSGKYAGKLAGVIGLMGYLPLGAARIQALRAEAELSEVVGEFPLMLARGGTDRLIPSWVWKRTLTDLEALKVERTGVQVGEYEGVGHTVTGTVMEQMVKWLDRHVPDLELGDGTTQS